MTARCDVHDWAMPKPGDHGISCRTCGRFLSFVGPDLNPRRRADVVGARTRRDGPEAGAAFATAIDAAYAARLARWRV